MKYLIYQAQVYSSLVLLIGTSIYIGMQVFCPMSLVLTVITK